jgi:putative ABC transport system ATP-binding protein
MLPIWRLPAVIGSIWRWIVIDCHGTGLAKDQPTALTLLIRRTAPLPPQMPPLIELQELHRHFVMGDSTVKAVDGVSFSIEQGEYVAIVGTSGSGKTTLMNMLGCLAKPTRGSYHLGGRSVAELSDDELSELRNEQIGFVFQNFQLLPRATAAKNVELPLVYRNVPRRERRQLAAEALEMVGLKDRMKHRPSELSGGQRQRVAIARALVTGPSLLLADEPTGNLDSATAKDILALLSTLHSEGNTIVIVTHEPSIAAQCPRAIRMTDGVVVADGPGSEVAEYKAS